MPGCSSDQRQETRLRLESCAVIEEQGWRKRGGCCCVASRALNRKITVLVEGL